MYILKQNFRLSDEEMAALNELPDNMPETRLSKKQKDLVNRVYYKYIECNIDNTGWRKPLYKLEQSEKWPSGNRMSIIQAKRIVLSPLITCNRRPELSDAEAARKFHSMLSGTREPWREINFAAYEYTGK